MLADSVRALLMHSYAASWDAHRPDWLQRSQLHLMLGLLPTPALGRELSVLSALEAERFFTVFPNVNYHIPSQKQL